MTTPIFDFDVYPTLATERCRLRQLTHADAPAILALFGDDEVMRYLNLEPPCKTLERSIEIIDWMNGWYEQKGGLRWGITLRDEDTVIGTCGFHNWEKEHRRVDIGFDLQPAYWNKGYMGEIAPAIVRWCFVYLDLHRVQADCTLGNIGSERVLLKTGFTYEGTWRENTFEHGRFVDLKQFGVLRREFFPTE